MGRPPHQFCWDNVDKLPEGKWRCKHCKEEFSGAASRIRNHLSGEGNDIGSCEEVPSHVREKASKRASKKRGRNSSSGEGSDGISAANRSEVVSATGNNSLDMATVLQVSSSNGDFSTNNANKGSEQEYTTDVLVRFLMSRNVPVDAAKDSQLRTLLTRVAQHGVPSCLLRDDFVGIQKSVWHFEHEVNEYMLMVKESWKTTGCTLICYKLNEGRGGKTSALDTNIVVYGFYCPKGFIFVEEQQLDLSNGLVHGFENHVLSLPMEYVTNDIHHKDHPRCEFAGQYFNDYGGIDIMDCARQEVQLLWRRICTETGWVHTLIQKSEKLYEFILNSNFYEDWRKEMVEKDEYDLLTRSFTHLESIMHLEDKIKMRLSEIVRESTKSWLDLAIPEIIINKEFWSDGKDLLKVVTPLIGIIDLVDTLVPNVGYLQVAIDKAKHNLKLYYEREVSKYHMIKGCLDSLTFGRSLKDDATTFFSPIYNAWRVAEGDLDPTRLIEDLDPTQAEWYLRYHVRREEAEEVVAEFKDYISKNPFARLSTSEWKYNHPVTVWNKHGGEFPVLKKCAIKLLSQPGSCMCKQVKQQMLQCQGKDNFILRLNYQMMQQFTKLGDGIYEHVEDSFFED